MPESLETAKGLPRPYPEILDADSLISYRPGTSFPDQDYLFRRVLLTPAGKNTTLAPGF